MADFADDFVTHLKTKAAITSLVGSGDAARIYPDDLKQGAAMPALVYAEVGGDHFPYLLGAVNVRHCLMEILAFGSTRSSANNLAETVRTSIAVGNTDATYGTTHVTEVQISAARDYGVDEPQDGSDAKRYWTRYVFDIWHAQTT
jgi:hypothetical protein